MTGEASRSVERQGPCRQICSIKSWSGTGQGGGGAWRDTARCHRSRSRLLSVTLPGGGGFDGIGDFTVCNSCCKLLPNSQPRVDLIIGPVGVKFECYLEEIAMNTFTGLGGLVSRR